MKKMKQLELPLVFKDKRKEDSFHEYLARNRRRYTNARMQGVTTGRITTTVTASESQGFYYWTRGII